LWGQLLFIILGAALAVGGLTIAFIGVTDVFVQTDLAYLSYSLVELQLLNDKLIPLIAHDRAGFGGALFSDAIVLLAISLWGIAQGEKWLWWTLLIGGFPALYAGLGVHMTIGYTDFIHLLPLYIAILLYVTGLFLLYPYMMSGKETVR
jgi:dihydroorotate dehydrogenase